LFRRALAIIERSYGRDHPNAAIHLNNLAELLRAMKQLTEAEPLLRRALAISEQGYGPDHPNVAIHLNNLASLLQATNRFTEAEPLMRRVVTIFLKFGQITHHTYPHLPGTINNYVQLLIAMKRSPLDIVSLLNALGQPYNVSFSIQCSA
jgi:tetratricopeptide (TPR) repeat protein